MIHSDFIIFTYLSEENMYLTKMKIQIKKIFLRTQIRI